MATESMPSPQTRADAARSAALWCAAATAVWWTLLCAAADAVCGLSAADVAGGIAALPWWFFPAPLLVVATGAASRVEARGFGAAALRAATVGSASLMLTATCLLGLLFVPHAVVYAHVFAAGSLLRLAAIEGGARFGEACGLTLAATLAAALPAAAIYAAQKAWRWTTRPASSEAPSSFVRRAADVVFATAACSATAMCLGTAFGRGFSPVVATVLFAASTPALVVGLCRIGSSPRRSVSLPDRPSAVRVRRSFGMTTPSAVDRRARRERRERRPSFWSAALAPWAAAVLWILLRDGLDSPMRPPSFAEALLVAALGVALSTLGVLGTTSLGRDEPVGIAGATLRGAAVGATSVVLVGAVAACAATLIFAAAFLMMGLIYLLAGAFFGLIALLAGVLIGGGAGFMVSAAYLAWRRTSRASTPLPPPSSARSLGAGFALAQYAAAAVAILGATALTRAAGLLPTSWSLAWCALVAALPAVEGLRRSNPLRSVAW